MREVLVARTAASRVGGSGAAETHPFEFLKRGGQGG
jgi:hypothetical protein